MALPYEKLANKNNKSLKIKFNGDNGLKYPLVAGWLSSR